MIKAILFGIWLLCLGFVVPAYIGMQVTLHDCGLKLPLLAGAPFTCAHDNGGGAFMLASVIGIALTIFVWNLFDRDY